jgi:hypothetical protein
VCPLFWKKRCNLFLSLMLMLMLMLMLIHVGRFLLMLMLMLMLDGWKCTFAAESRPLLLLFACVLVVVLASFLSETSSADNRLAAAVTLNSRTHFFLCLSCLSLNSPVSCSCLLQTKTDCRVYKKYLEEYIIQEFGRENIFLHVGVGRLKQIFFKPTLPFWHFCLLFSTFCQLLFSQVELNRALKTASSTSTTTY